MGLGSRREAGASGKEFWGCSKGTDVASVPAEGANPADTLTVDFRPLELGDNIFAVQAPQYVGLATAALARY